LQKTADYYNKNLYLCKTVQNGQETTNLLHIELQQKSSTIFTKVTQDYNNTNHLDISNTNSNKNIGCLGQ
jgi:hypothetical protein